MPSGSLFVAPRGHIKELLVLHTGQHRNVPLAGDVQAGGKEVGILAVQVQRGHTAHGLARGVQAICVDGIFALKLLDQLHCFVDLRVSLPVVCGNCAGKGRHQYKGSMLGLFLIGYPHRRAVILSNDVGSALACPGGIRDEHDQRIRLGSVIILRNIQAVLETDARFLIGKGRLFELGSVCIQHCLDLLIILGHAARTAAMSTIRATHSTRATHTALSQYSN